MTYKLKAVGADPEFFLFDEKKNKPVPAIGLIGGTKEKPQFINDDKFSAIQEDNVMVEFNIKPARTPEEFVANTYIVMNYLNLKCHGLGLTPLVKPALEFASIDLAHPQAQEIGCLGDFNAWSWRPNPPITPIDLGLIRVAGGHVHVSYSFKDKAPEKDDQHQVVRMLDLALGVPSVLLDEDITRRRFYGRAGCFRPKEYGVEYRTLSNFWISKKETIEWVFNQVLWAFKQLKEQPRIPNPDEYDIMVAINDNHKDKANELVQKYAIQMPI